MLFIHGCMSRVVYIVKSYCYNCVVFVPLSFHTPICTSPTDPLPIDVDEIADIADVLPTD